MKYLQKYYGFIVESNQGDFLAEAVDPNSIDKFNRIKVSGDRRDKYITKKQISKGNITEQPNLRVYHRTKDANVKLIGRDGFRSGAGNAWGDGIYTCYDLISTTILNEYNDGLEKINVYGPVIIESSVKSLEDFLIFDYDVAEKVYGKKHDLVTQCELILPKLVFENHKSAIETAANVCEKLSKATPKNKHTARAFDYIVKISQIMDNLRGVIFTGEFDGKVLLSYDRENIAPLRYSDDNGKNWKKIEEQTAYQTSKSNLKELLKSNNSKKLFLKVQDHFKNYLTTNLGATYDVSKLDLKKQFDVSYDINSRFKQRFGYINDLMNQLASKDDEESKKYLSDLKELKSKIDEYLGDFNKNLKNEILNIKIDDDYLVEVFKIFGKLYSANLKGVPDFVSVIQKFLKDLKSYDIKLEEIENFEAKFKKLAIFLLKKFESEKYLLDPEYLKDVSINDFDTDDFLKRYRNLYLEEYFYKIKQITFNNAIERTETLFKLSLGEKGNILTSITIKERYPNMNQADLLVKTFGLIKKSNIYDEFEKIVLDNLESNLTSAFQITDNYYTTGDFFEKMVNQLPFIEKVKKQFFSFANDFNFTKKITNTFDDYFEQGSSPVYIKQSIDSVITADKPENLKTIFETIANFINNANYTSNQNWKVYQEAYYKTKSIEDFGIIEKSILAFSLASEELMSNLQKNGTLRPEIFSHIRIYPLIFNPEGKNKIERFKELFDEKIKLLEEKSDIFSNPINKDFIGINLGIPDIFRIYQLHKDKGKFVKIWDKLINRFILNLLDTYSYSSSIDYSRYDKMIVNPIDFIKKYKPDFNNVEIFDNDEKTKEEIISSSLKNVKPDLFVCFPENLQKEALINYLVRFYDKYAKEDEKEQMGKIDIEGFFKNEENKIKYLQRTKGEKDKLLIPFEKGYIKLSEIIENVDFEKYVQTSSLSSLYEDYLKKIVLEGNIDKLQALLDFAKEKKLSISSIYGLDSVCLESSNEIIDLLIENQLISLDTIYRAHDYGKIKNDRLSLFLIKKYPKLKGINQIVGLAERPETIELFDQLGDDTVDDLHDRLTIFIEKGQKDFDNLINWINRNTIEHHETVVILMFFAKDKEKYIQKLKKETFEKGIASLEKVIESEGLINMLDHLEREKKLAKDLLGLLTISNQVEFYNCLLPYIKSEKSKKIIQEYLDKNKKSNEKKILDFKHFIRRL